jgi:hypothetical protein
MVAQPTLRICLLAVVCAVKPQSYSPHTCVIRINARLNLAALLQNISASAGCQQRLNPACWPALRPQECFTDCVICIYARYNCAALLQNISASAGCQQRLNPACWPALRPQECFTDLLIAIVFLEVHLTLKNSQELESLQLASSHAGTN